MTLYRYHAEPYPEFSGPSKVNDHLENGQKLFENEIIGPEGFAIDSNGTTLYSQHNNVLKQSLCLNRSCIYWIRRWSDNPAKQRSSFI